MCGCIRHQEYWIAFPCSPCGEFPIQFPHNWNPWSVETDNQNEQSVSTCNSKGRFPNKFHQSLQWMRFCKSCIAMMLSMSDITILSISIYASSALENYGGLPFGSRSSGLRVILIPELWGSNHDHHKLMGSKVATATLWSLNAGDQNILIPLLRPSHHCDPRICKDQTIKSMIQIDRVLMIAQPWVSKQVPS